MAGFFNDYSYSDNEEPRLKRKKIHKPMEVTMTYEDDGECVVHVHIRKLSQEEAERLLIELGEKFRIKEE